MALARPKVAATSRAVLACSIAFAFLHVGLARAQAPTRATEVPAAVVAVESALVDVIARAERSVVAISRSAPAAAGQPQVLLEFGDNPFQNLQANVPRTTPHAHGAGVIIDPEGLILTQYLVVKVGDKHTVKTIEGKVYEAEIRAADPHSGLAVLAVTASDMPALPLAEAENLRKGQMVVAIGNPYAIESDGQPTASWGIVSNLARKAAPQDNFNNVNDPTGAFRTTLHHFGTLIQTDARLGWSSSGGALVNLDGELVGLTTSVDTISGHEAAAGYAIPMNGPMRRVIGDLKEGREVEYGLLGIRFNAEDVVATPQGDRGVVVMDVFAGSPADRAGIQRNDIITHVDGRPIPDTDSLQLAVRYLPPIQNAAVRIVRGGEPLRTEVSIGKYYVDGEKVVTSPAADWRGMRVDHPTAIPAAQLQQSAQLGELDPQGCVVVTDVVEKSPAWTAGVRPGMFVSHVGEQRVTTPQEFRQAIAGATTPVSLKFVQSVRHAEREAIREIPASP